jgi:hypothetical protein
MLLPDFLDLPHPASFPLGYPASYPNGFDQFAPPVTSANLAAGAPLIVDFTRTALPNQTVAIAGDALSAFTGQDQSKDTEFLTWASPTAPGE